MKYIFSYKTWRNILCATGLPFFSMLLSGCYKYGVPDDWHDIHGTVIEHDSHEPIDSVTIQEPNGNHELTFNGGHFGIAYIDDDGCTTLTFSKEGFQTLDTTLCDTGEDIEIELEKLP